MGTSRNGEGLGWVIILFKETLMRRRGEDPNTLPPPRPFLCADVYRAALGLCQGWAWGGLALLCHLGYHLQGRMGTGPASPGHLHHHSSLERQQLVPRTKGGWEGPNPPLKQPTPAFLVGFPFAFLCVCVWGGVFIFKFPLQLCGGIWRLALTRSDWVTELRGWEGFEIAGHVPPLQKGLSFPLGAAAS